MHAPTQRDMMEVLAAPLPSGFSAAQKAALQAPLDADHVKEREQAGRTFSYVEGWRVIEEANRIFGFDGWTRQTVEIKCVAEHPRKFGKAPNQRDGFGVSYIAKVHVVVLAGATQVTREGIGAGHGIDADVGLAHESAIKEAETDAMKRAFVTFGNAFGLALYDKAQSNVVRLPKANCRDLYAHMQDEIDGCSAPDELVAWGSDAAARMAVLPEGWVEILRSRFAEKLAALRQYQASEEVVWDDDGERPAIAHPTPPPKRERPKTIVQAPKHSLKGGIAEGAITRRYEQAVRSTGPSQPFLASEAGKALSPRFRAEAGYDERNPPPHDTVPDQAAKALNARLHPFNDELPDDLGPPKQLDRSERDGVPGFLDRRIPS